jgi:hypothetical protein
MDASIALLKLIIIFGVAAVVSGGLGRWRYGHGLGDRAFEIFTTMVRLGTAAVAVASCGLGVLLLFR